MINLDRSFENHDEKLIVIHFNEKIGDWTLASKNRF